MPGDRASTMPTSVIPLIICYVYKTLQQAVSGSSEKHCWGWWFSNRTTLFPRGIFTSCKLVNEDDTLRDRLQPPVDFSEAISRQTLQGLRQLLPTLHTRLFGKRPPDDQFDVDVLLLLAHIEEGHLLLPIWLQLALSTGSFWGR